MKKSTKLKDSGSQTLKNKEWEDDEQLLCNNKMCKFNVQYLGLMEINEFKEDFLYQKAMESLLKKKKQPGEMKISSYSIIWQDKHTHNIILDQTMKKMIFCEAYTKVPYAFFYVAEDQLSEMCQLYGFISMKEVSEKIVNAIQYAKQLFSEKQIEIQKPIKFSQEDSSTMFRQASLAEKYQDPQSSIIIPFTQIKSSKTVNNLKSVPRPRGGKSTERKIFGGNFEKQNYGDKVKSHDMSSRSVDSKFDVIVGADLAEIFNDSCNLTFNNFSGCSSDEKLKNIHSINEAFYTQIQPNKVIENKCSPMNEPFFQENGSSQDSRYDSFKNLSNQSATGWSDYLVKGNEKKPAISKSYNDYLNQIIIPDIFNMGAINFDSSSSLKK